MALPEEGSKAPAFTAKDENGKTWKLTELKGKPVVLFFYPKDDTPGCIKEACGLRDEMAALKRFGAVVLGVSRDDASSHQKFIAKYNLNMPLLVDTDGKISDAYGTWVEKNLYGRTYMGLQRATFLIAPDGKIAKVWPKVKPEEHTAQVLEALAHLSTSLKA